MGMYRKRPVVVEARKVDYSSADTVAAWCGGRVVSVVQNLVYTDWTPFRNVSEDDRSLTFHSAKGIEIETLEGTMLAAPGSYVIRGVQGEFYPCDATIFEQTYEPVDD
jgi:hypothetical protein